MQTNTTNACELFNDKILSRLRDNALDSDQDMFGRVAQRQDVGLWPANFPCPALDL